MSWIKTIVLWSVPLLIVLFTLEISGYTLSKFGLLLFNEAPVIYIEGASALKGDGRGVNWRTENSPWGAWHKPNFTDYHSKSCFSVKYETNEIGARDESFANLPETGKRYILLGDSFAEGWGVSKDKTVDTHLEKMLGAKVLDFGSAGDFGPVQYKLIYDQLARNYQHDGIILFFLPSNDFIDNDPSIYTKKSEPPRWRPYYKKAGEDQYIEFYPDGARKRDKWIPDKTSFRLQHFAAMYLWSFNIYRTAEYLLSNGKKLKSYSGYFDAELEQQKAAVHYIKALIDEVSPKPVTLVIIPREADFARIDAGESLDRQYWYNSLMELSSSKKNIKIVDLAKFRDVDINKLFLPCDNHWSELGNEWAAKHIAENM